MMLNTVRVLQNQVIPNSLHGKKTELKKLIHHIQTEVHNTVCRWKKPFKLFIPCI